MTEREEIIAQLKNTRALVSGVAPHLPFAEKTSQYLDLLDQLIERMEKQE